RPQARRLHRIGLVAAAVALVSLGFAGFRILTGRTPSVEFGADEFVTGPEDVSTVTLRDGSVVRLGPRTRLTLTGRGSNREVRLEGRAFFAVAHAPERPFRILTSAGTVTALGTRFDLQARVENLDLALLEGRVVLSTPGKEVSLQAGEAARVVDGTPLPVARIPDGDRLIQWAGNFLAFQQTPLDEAAQEIERHYGMRIAITDSSLAHQTVTAWFVDRGLGEVLRILCAATLAECSLEPGHV